jgi:hypothetical protein
MLENAQNVSSFVQATLWEHEHKPERKKPNGFTNANRSVRGS